jgi:hypothetical protein
MKQTVYINWKGGQGRETLDEVRREDFPQMTWREFRAECRRLLEEYGMAGMPGAYLSPRCCANWKD